MATTTAYTKAATKLENTTNCADGTRQYIFQEVNKPFMIFQNFMHFRAPPMQQLAQCINPWSAFSGIIRWMVYESASAMADSDVSEVDRIDGKERDAKI
jgi:hypothetical protein